MSLMFEVTDCDLKESVWTRCSIIYKRLRSQSVTSKLALKWPTWDCQTNVDFCSRLGLGSKKEPLSPPREKFGVNGNLLGWRQDMVSGSGKLETALYCLESARYLTLSHIRTECPWVPSSGLLSGAVVMVSVFPSSL